MKYSSQLMLALLVFLAACEKKAPPALPIPEVSVVIAKVTTEPVLSQLVGRLEAYRQAEVRARAAGIVMSKLYQEGQEVKAGTALFRIDPAPMKAAYDITGGQVQSAKASLVAAEDRLDRYQGLREVKAVSEMEYASAVSEAAQAKAALASAEASQKNARLNLDYATVTSPIEGRARRAMVTEGALVGLDSPTPLTIVEQIDPIYANFSQPARDVLLLRQATNNGSLEKIAEENIEVEIVLADGTSYSEKGKLLFSDLAVDPKTDTVAMRAVFPNKRGELLPGAFVSLKLARALNKTAILIPRDGLIRGNDSASVMIVNAENKVEMVPVVANQLKGTNWIVSSGLKGGEQVILSNPGMLMPGSLVKAVPKAESSTVAPTQIEQKAQIQ
ncbi:MAG: efflux RND transporter periplasmic adaptor subunit [Bdellovibrionota bacterium]